MKLLPLLLALSLCACAVHESEWNYADGVQRSHGHHNPRPAVLGKKPTAQTGELNHD